jgi:glycerol-3-phosphate cytidylyltransferase
MKLEITFSTFDLLHAGHLEILDEAKRQFDYLILRLQLDSIDRPEKNVPAQSSTERSIQLKGSKDVDYLVPYVSEQDSENVVRSFKLGLRMIGDVNKKKNYAGRYYC